MQPKKSVTDPIHPGEILLEEFMKPLGLTSNGLAMALRVPAARIHAIVSESRGITADTALRLSRYFSTTSEFWMNLQRDYDLRTVARSSRAEIERAFSHARLHRDLRLVSPAISGWIPASACRRTS
jgi:addiction module HigA family antidote